MKDDDIELTTQKLKWLRLPGMADQLRPVLAKAAKVDTWLPAPRKSMKSAIVWADRLVTA